MIKYRRFRIFSEGEDIRKYGERRKKVSFFVWRSYFMYQFLLSHRQMVGFVRRIKPDDHYPGACSGRADLLLPAGTSGDLMAIHRGGKNPALIRSRLMIGRIDEGRKLPS